MPSPFLQRPPSEWVASNALAFAIRDAFPVSPGHTLIIPRREIATWFDATRDEQLAILDLIAAVKHVLDVELAPAGYNVGFNAGAAAGQTVMHLHVHVIPRFEGDLDDPRGGVRHVIPHRGNYLRAGVLPLATGGAKDPFLAHLAPLFARAARIDIVAAFVQDSGLELLGPHLFSAVERGGHVRVLTGDYLGITQVKALERLLGWSRAGTASAAELESGGGFDARVVETREDGGTARSFHPKSWRFEGPGLAVAFVGSSNVSHAALQTGVEWNLRVDRDRDRGAYDAVATAFAALWERALPLTPAWIERYAERAIARTAPLAPAAPMEADSPDPEAPPGPPEPHSVQREALEALAADRAAGRRRALVVLATGLGKTWLAAFDVAAVRAERGAWPRVLFVAHRAEILRQAQDTFHRLLAAETTPRRFGLCAGDEADLDGDVVFASVQKLARPEQLIRLHRHAFDYVVIDEVHHAEAETYRRLLDRLDPGFLLGLTATPDRADGGDILGAFDDNVAYRADLGAGIAAGRLVPFDYFGLKDEVDYRPENVPWRNRRFDPDALERAVETDRRMEQLWQAWQEHPGARSLVFCCSIHHARFTARWLAGRGLKVAAVFAGPESADRTAAVDDLAAGRLEAICSVDVFNEGLDVPRIDRVVMLRPTESPVVFLQQLGRGLRRVEAKERLTVIDFVGNHRVFLSRVRTLLSLAGAGDALPRLIETGRLTELPSGCEIRVELEAVELLARLIPRGKSEVQRAYRELRALRGVRPTAGELYRMGFLPSSVRDGAGGWFDFVASEGDLEAAESAVLEAARSWFAELERTAMTKSFKMVVLDVLLEADALATGLTFAELAARCHERLLRSPELLPDLEGVQELQPDPSRPDPEVWEAYWRKNPIAAWTSTPQQRPWFAVEADRFVPRLPTAPGAEETFARMTREVVDYRLARYRRGQGGRSGFECKVTWNQRDPILKLPARAEHPDLPDGETDVRLPDGALWRFRLAREFCNVARPVGTDRNQLPDLMRRWFGVAAGKPGTGFHVRFSPSPDGWWLEPAEAQVIELPARGRVIAFPSLRAAAGAAAGAVTAAPDSEEVALPIREGGEEVFAIRATGDSMDGGRAPIRDGDWLVMRYARGANVAGVEGRVALVETANALEGGAFQVKRVVRAGSAWQLRSDNPARPSYEASAAATVIASLVEVVRPESLGPAVGTTLAPEDMAGAFGVSGAVVTGRVDGHLFLCVEDATALVAPDRLRVVVADRRPGETAFVLLRGAEGWRYCGVARWRESEELWDFPALDYASWRALGKGRSSSRTLPPGAMEQAEALIARVLEPGPGYWIADGERRCRVVGAASKGGLRIDGGAGGFGERTVSVIDIGWVLVAQEECRLEGGILDEARVNRRRYLEGTPKGATRWIDTRWAIVLARGTREGAGT